MFRPEHENDDSETGSKPISRVRTAHPTLAKDSRCYRYKELNPVRALMVESPADYRWSSHNHIAFGKPDRLITLHAQFLALGDDEDKRRHAYRELFRHHMDHDLLHRIRAATETGTPLGNDRIGNKIEKTLGKKVRQAQRGRPKKMKLVGSPEVL